MKSFNLFARFSHAKKQPLPEKISQVVANDNVNLSYPRQVVVVSHILDKIHEQLSALRSGSASHKFNEPALEVEAFKRSLQILVADNNHAELSNQQKVVDNQLKTLVHSMLEIFYRCPDAVPEALKDGITSLDVLRTQLDNATHGLKAHLKDERAPEQEPSIGISNS